MNIINSAELGGRPTSLGKESGMLDIYGGLSTPFSDDVIALSPEHVREIEEFVARSAAAFGPEIGEKEPTYSQQNFGLPSLVVRADCTIVDGWIAPYEMEDSPSGQGITDLIHQRVGARGVAESIRAHYLENIGQLPLVIISGARRHGTDDKVVFGDENYVFDTDTRFVAPDDRLVIVKAIPGDVESREPYMGLQNRTLMPLATEGDKTYLKRTGVVQPIESPDQLLINDSGELVSQIVKAQVSSMAMGVSLYLTPEDRQRFTRAGTVTAAKLQRDVETYSRERGGALLQPYLPPIQIENDQRRGNAILRVFSLLNTTNGEVSARVIGGCYVARPELIVHGASNAVSGAVIIEGGE